MSPADILGVAIKQYRSGEFRTLVPKVVGLTSAGESKKVRRSAGNRRSDNWTIEEFFTQLDKTSLPAGVAARRIVAHFTDRQFKMWGGTGRFPTFVPVIYDSIKV
jgi:hypothetical protein